MSRTSSSQSGRELAQYMAMMAMYFLVVCAVGILRPIKNSLALDGLGETDFYKVYVVSAGVVLFVPLYNRLARRIPWRWLVPGVAAFFALNLVLFRLWYVEGSGTFGLLFYGWYDLFAAALVTQFFIATQLFLNTRSAKRAYPLIITGGSIGAALGGAITGFFAGVVGTPNLLLLAAALILVFSIGMPFSMPRDTPHPQEKGPQAGVVGHSLRELREVFGNRQVQLIAATVLLTVLVKQLVDYQFNTISKDVFIERDAISAFQGKYNGATQWLPILVLAALRPGLQRWGIGFAVLLLPVFMVGTNAALAAAWGLWAAIAAKTADTSLRYSADRTGRELLYVPVPDEIKLKAKTYIDVAVEKGVGKALSALLIFVLLLFIEYRQIAYVAVGMSVVWLGLALAIRREYLRTLARSIEGRFASLKGGFASLLDANTLSIVRNALATGTPLQISFAMDLVEHASPADARGVAAELNGLTDHRAPEIRERALNLLARLPGYADEHGVRARLADDAPAVREAAVRALAAGRRDHRALIEELLGSPDVRTRSAALAALARREIGDGEAGRLGKAYVARRRAGVNGDAEERIELALAIGVVRDDPEIADHLDPLLDDPDPRVRAAALRSAGRIGHAIAFPRLLADLGSPATREAVREALIAQGAGVVPVLHRYLNDDAGDPNVRRQIPAVLARIPAQDSVDALLNAVIAPETDQLLDHRALKALSKLRAGDGVLTFAQSSVLAIADREVAAARLYDSAITVLDRTAPAARTAPLLRKALVEAREERREGVFRCLGLLHPREGVHRTYLAVTRGSPAVRANGLEWLERTLGHALFARLGDLLEPDGHARPPSDSTLPAVLARLRDDGDGWIADCATALAAELKRDANVPAATHPGRTMHPVEKVFLLQQVDLLQGARSSHLALLASIAEEVELTGDTVVVPCGEPAGALYVVRRGAVELAGEGERLIVSDSGAFGTWALIDDAPSPVQARTTRPTQLLRIARGDFHDLLADHPELALGVLQGLARRVRGLIAR